MEILLGFLIAFTIGLTGVGGGSLTAPALLLCTGLPPAVAVGTAQLFSAGVKLPAAGLYALRGEIDWRLLDKMLRCGVAGLLLGLFLLRGAAGGSRAVLAAIGTTVLLSAAAGLHRLLAKKTKHAASSDGGAKLELVSALIGLSVGFSAAGAGSLGMTALLGLTALPVARAVGTDLVFGFALSLLGGGLNAIAGHTDWKILTALALGGVPGALAGAWLAHHIPPRPARAVVFLLLLVNGGQLLWRGLHPAA